MIRNYSCENFCSFRDHVEFSLLTGAKTPTDYSYVPSLSGDQISVLAGVFGPNASGKTNLLKPLAFLNYFLRHSYQEQERGDGLPVDPFFTNTTEPTRFTLEFEGSGQRYRYELSLTRQEIQEEKLMLRSPESGQFRTLLTRSQGKERPTVSVQHNFTDATALRQLLRDRPNASVIAAGLVTGRPEFQQVLHSLGGFETNVDRLGKTEVGQSNRIGEVLECARYFQDNPHFLEDLEQRLKSADLGIAGLKLKEIDMLTDKGDTRKAPMPFVIHRSGNKQFSIPLTHESSGTKRLFVLLRSFLPVLTSGGIAVIDEMESDLHPHLIPLLLDLFVDSSTNPKRAQLIFTCHHVEILNLLAKEQIMLVQKDAQNISHARRLADIKGIRREENFFANYNAGRYEAVPEPELF